MSKVISRSIDIEDAIRVALTEYMAVYCRPLPEKYELPCILINQVGGDTEANASGRGKIDNFTVVLDSRAKTEAEAVELLNNAIALLEASENSGISYVSLNTHGSWGSDPVRPDLAMCSATLLVKAHRETTTI